MKKVKIVYVLTLMLLTLLACTEVSKAAQKEDAPSGISQVDRAVITQPAVQPTEPEVKAQPEVTQTAVKATPQPEATAIIEAKCFRNSDRTRLLINSVYGYCLQYPAGYDVDIATPTMVVLFKISVLNATDPNFYIDVQPANGMTVEQAAEQRLKDYTVPGLESSRTEISLDGVKAFVLDGLTGQDPNRQVVVVHNDTLYILYFVLMDRNQPEIVAQAEELYNTVIKSFNFRPETNLCTDCVP